MDNIILFLLMIPFVPLFFFASMYAQISLGESASETGLYLLIFFAGFATASQRGGRLLDKVGARSRRRPRLRDRRRRLLPLGQLDDRTLGLRPVVLDRPRRDRRRARPQPGQHRRAEPGLARSLRRGDRDHPDRAQLRLQPRAGGAGLDPDPAEPLQPRSDAPTSTASRSSSAVKSPTRSARAPGPAKCRRTSLPQPNTPSRKSSTASPTTSPSPRVRSSTGWPR